MGALATAQGVVKRGTNVFVTQEDVAILMNCKKSKAYDIVRNVNNYAKVKGCSPFPAGKANKYLFAEIYGIPIEDVDRIVSESQEAAYEGKGSKEVCRDA